MTVEVLPDIPRIYTALAEWLACMVFVGAVGLRRPRRLSLIYAGLSLPIFIVIQEIAGKLPLQFWMVSMFVAIMAIMLTVRVCANADWSGAVYVGSRAFVLAELVASLEWQLQYFFIGNPERAEQALQFAWMIGTYAIAFPLVYLLVRRQFVFGEQLRVEPASMWAAFAIASATFFVSNLSFVPVLTPFSGTVAAEIFTIRTLIDATGFAALYAQESQRMRTAEALELEGAQMLLRHQHTQYLQSRASIDEVNRKYHDLKYYITAFRAETSQDRRLEYLDRLEQSVIDYENQVESGNVAVDAILSAKKAASAQARITLTAVVDGAVVAFIDPLDLSVILGNALDNAIESVSNLEGDDRKLIKVAIFHKGDFAVMRVENYFDSQVTFTEGLPVTTKADARSHGYGLRNVREAVEKYDGTVSIRAEDGWFSVRTLIPIPTRNQKSLADGSY